MLCCILNFKTCQTKLIMATALSSSNQLQHRNPFNMRLKTLTNLQLTPSFQKNPSKLQNMAIQRMRSAVSSNAAKTLDHLRVLSQKSLNREINLVIQRYITRLFLPAIENIKQNCGESAVTEEHISYVCRQILEEAQKMYITPSELNGDEYSELPSKRKAVELIHDDDASDISSSTDNALSSISTSKRFKAQSVEQSSQIRALSTPLSQRLQDITPEEMAKWNPERIQEDTEFIMGSKANKALGMGAQRGKIYTKFPCLFRYVVADQQDRTWLFENKLLPMRFGGKAFIMFLSDVEEILGFPEYKGSSSINRNELCGFKVPEWFAAKMRQLMQSEYSELQKRLVSECSTKRSRMSNLGEFTPLN